MVRMKTRLNKKGQLVIPKAIRERVGLVEQKEAIIEVKGKAIQIRPFNGNDLVEKAAERAKKHGGDLKKLGWLYGDRLYEEEFE